MGIRIECLKTIKCNVGNLGVSVKSFSQESRRHKHQHENIQLLKPRP